MATADHTPSGPPFQIISTCKGGGYRYCRTQPPHPRANSKGLYPLHRVLAENKIGRLLSSSEDVHHDDEDKGNDNPCNLVVKTHSKHTADHMWVATIKCVCRCGKEFELKPYVYRKRLKQSRRGAIFCSLGCSAMKDGAPTRR